MPGTFIIVFPITYCDETVSRSIDRSNVIQCPRLFKVAVDRGVPGPSSLDGNLFTLSVSYFQSYLGMLYKYSKLY